LRIDVDTDIRDSIIFTSSHPHTTVELSTHDTNKEYTYMKEHEHRYVAVIEKHTYRWC